MADLMSATTPSPAAVQARMRARLDSREDSLREALERLELRLRDEIEIRPKISAAIDEHIETIVIGSWLLGFWLGRRPAGRPR